VKGFNPYHPDALEEAEYRRRGELAGRSIGGQIRFEEDTADRLYLARYRAIIADRNAHQHRLYGPTPYTNRHGSPIDPMDEDRYL
jgi:hypothetical protein